MFSVQGCVSLSYVVLLLNCALRRSQYKLLHSLRKPLPAHVSIDPSFGLQFINPTVGVPRM